MVDCSVKRSLWSQTVTRSVGHTGWTCSPSGRFSWIFSPFVSAIREPSFFIRIIFCVALRVRRMSCAIENDGGNVRPMTYRSGKTSGVETSRGDVRHTVVVATGLQSFQRSTSHLVDDLHRKSLCTTVQRCTSGVEPTLCQSRPGMTFDGGGGGGCCIVVGPWRTNVA